MAVMTSTFPNTMARTISDMRMPMPPRHQASSRSSVPSWSGAWLALGASKKTLRFPGCPMARRLVSAEAAGAPAALSERTSGGALRAKQASTWKTHSAAVGGCGCGRGAWCTQLGGTLDSQCRAVSASSAALWKPSLVRAVRYVTRTLGELPSP